MQKYSTPGETSPHPQERARTRCGNLHPTHEREATTYRSKWDEDRHRQIPDFVDIGGVDNGSLPTERMQSPVAPMTPTSWRGRSRHRRSLPGSRNSTLHGNGGYACPEVNEIPQEAKSTTCHLPTGQSSRRSRLRNCGNSPWRPTTMESLRRRLLGWASARRRCAGGSASLLARFQSVDCSPWPFWGQ